MFTVPCGELMRVQKSSRNFAEPFVSVYTPKFFRSLLFGGIEPLTIVGLASSSFVP